MKIQFELALSFQDLHGGFVLQIQQERECSMQTAEEKQALVCGSTKVVHPSLKVGELRPYLNRCESNLTADTNVEMNTAQHALLRRSLFC